MISRTNARIIRENIYFPSSLPLLRHPFSFSLPLCLVPFLLSVFFLISTAARARARANRLRLRVQQRRSPAHYLSRVLHDTLVHIALPAAGRVHPPRVRCKNRLWNGAPATALPKRVLLVASAGSSEPATPPSPQSVGADADLVPARLYSLSLSFSFCE